METLKKKKKKKKKNCQSNPEEKKLSRKHNSPRQYYKAIIINTVWFWYTNRPMDQWNRIESLEIINPHTYSQMIFNNACKNMKWYKESPLSK